MNNKLKKTLIILTLTFGILFSGCTKTTGQQSGILGFGDSNSNTKSSGNGGVALEIQKLNFKPQKNNEFSLVLNVKNFQTEKVDVKIKPTGFDWNYVKAGLQKEITLSLNPATDSAPNQNAHYLEGIKLNGFTGNYNWDPTFKYCYNTKTKFREQICIPNKLNKCEADPGNSKYQNGPLQSTVKTIYPIGDTKIGIDIEVQNSNNGYVVNECFQDENKNEFGNKITEPIVKLGTKQGKCTPTSSSNGFIINQNKLTFKCEFDRSGDPTESYSSLISLEYSYNYEQKISNKITIVDLEQTN